MTVVREIISGKPVDSRDRVISRDEAKLFETPAETAAFIKMSSEPLAVYQTPVTYDPGPFTPPRGVFQGPVLRLEWQRMDGRQPFYHRNAEAEEIGFQVAGERTLMTECGTINFKRGQFASIPVGVAHDNHGREDVHLIFYLHGPVETAVEPVSRGEHRMPPYEGWQPKPSAELFTEGLGDPQCSLAYAMTDETHVFEGPADPGDMLEVLEPSAATGTVEWLYRAPKVWIGHQALDRASERVYHRYTRADEIQYQVEGTRTIFSQRGTVTLQPGDFTTIPAGCAYASDTEGTSKHLSILVAEPTPSVRQPDRFADPDVLGKLASFAMADA